MDNNQKITILALVLLAIVIGVSAYGYAEERSGSSMFGMMRQRDNRMMQDIDKHFIEQMIPHHEDAIKMAEIALTKAEHKEIKQLAQNIIDAQKKENETMKGWYRSWYGADVPAWSGMGMTHEGGMHMGMMGDSSDVSNLETAKPFDKAFIDEMIPHHQMAVMMANMLVNSSKRPEMVQLGKDIVEAQTKEISEMRAWYDSWY